MDYLDYSRMPDHIRRHYSILTDSGTEDRSLLEKFGYFDINRFFGESGIDVGSVIVDHRADPFKLTDPIVAQYADAIASLMTERGQLRTGPPVMKLLSADWNERRLEVCPVDFALVAGTCLALDVRHELFAGKGETLREYYKNRYPSNRVEDNRLAISLGVCGLLLVESEDGLRFLSVRRSEKLITLAGTIGPSVAGNVDYDSQLQTIGEIIQTQMRIETSEELGLSEDEYSIVPLAYAREVFRGDRPQLFTLIQCHIDLDELDDRLVRLCESGGEFDQHEFVTAKAAPVGLNHEAAMNVHLMQEYLGL